MEGMRMIVTEGCEKEKNDCGNVIIVIIRGMIVRKRKMIMGMRMVVRKMMWKKILRNMAMRMIVVEIMIMNEFKTGYYENDDC